MYLEARYRLLKSTWGISIHMGAIGVVVTKPPTDSVDIESAERSVIVRNKSGIVLLDNEKHLLLKAVKRAEPIAKKILGDNHIIIDITRLEFSYCDYQEEGIYAVFIKWFTQFFVLPEIEVPAIYDKISNKYVFQIG